MSGAKIMDKIIDNKIYEEVINNLKDAEYILADTRIPFISLYDHLILTSGIAVAIAKELLIRGEEPKDISGIDITERELITVVRAASLLHDWGKDDEKAYINHRDRSVEWSKGLLRKSAIEEPYFSLIISAIERHQLSYNPRTRLEKIVCLADSLASAGDRSKLAERTGRLREFVDFRHSTSELYHEIFGEEKGLALLSGDVDAVKSYVYETSKLPEIRGGSEILNELNNEGMEGIFSKELSKECLIYNKGGGFLAIVPASLAEALIKEIQEEYLDRTKIATITCKSYPLGYYDFERGLKPYVDEEVKKLRGAGIGNWLLESHYGTDRDHWTEKKNFAELVSYLSAELRREKVSREYIPFYETLPIGRRCQSCGKRMASEEDITGGEVFALCEICYHKRETGRERRFLLQFSDWLKRERGLEGMENILILKAPKDLDDLTEEGYMAFISADGNDIGSLLEKANSPAHYRHIAEELHEGTRDAVFSAIFDVLGREKLEKTRKLPFEIINIGGDDITLIIAAPYAFEFSRRFLERFEDNMEKTWIKN